MNLAQVADYFFLSDRIELPEAPKIGIVLTAITKNEKKLLEISQISPHGKAGEAGLLKGDILKEVNGFIVNEMSDIRIAMVNAQEGETVVMKILRKDGSALIEIQIEVELSSSPSPMMHP
jgi:S1-C subfamily serine protease